MQYKLSNQVSGGVIQTNDQGIISFVPENPDNADWQVYQRWLALGNTPQAADD